MPVPVTGIAGSTIYARARVLSVSIIGPLRDGIDKGVAIKIGCRPGTNAGELGTRIVICTVVGID